MARTLARAALVTLASLGLVACADETLVEVPEPEPPARNVSADPPAEEPEDEPAPPADSGDACTDDDDCGEGSECEAGVCVGVGVLQFTLTWSTDTDLDLYVQAPSGEIVSFLTPQAAGGVLDVDQCIGFCEPGTHVENVFFNSLRPGFYTAWAENYDGRDAATYTLTVSGAAELTDTGFLDDFPGEATAPLELFIAD